MKLIDAHALVKKVLEETEGTEQGFLVGKILRIIMEMPEVKGEEDEQH